MVELEEITKLRGFATLVGERWGYWTGRRMKSAEMSQATEVERKTTLKDARKAAAITGKARDEAVALLISGEKDTEKPIADLRMAIVIAQRAADTAEKEVATVSSAISEKAKPFRLAMAPLVRAVNYLDQTAIPDSLAELGTPVTPRFSLSSWIVEELKAIKAQKKK